MTSLCLTLHYLVFQLSYQHGLFLNYRMVTIYGELYWMICHIKFWIFSLKIGWNNVVTWPVSNTPPCRGRCVLHCIHKVNLINSMYASSEHYNQYMLQNNIIHINIHEKPYMMIQDDTYMRMHDDTKWYKRIQKNYTTYLQLFKYI